MSMARKEMREISNHLYSVYNVIRFCDSRRLRVLRKRIAELGETNCGWVEYWAKDLLAKFGDDVHRNWRKDHGRRKNKNSAR